VVTALVAAIVVDDPVLLAIVATGFLSAVFLSLRELREPFLYLQPTPRQVVTRTLKRAAAGVPDGLKVGNTPERVAWLQDELDVLTAPRKVKTPTHRRIILIGGSANVALILIVAVVVALRGGFSIAAAFTATGLLLGAGIWLLAKMERRRIEAVRALEHEIAAAQHVPSVEQGVDLPELASGTE
jgi:hypothetical protein